MESGDGTATQGKGKPYMYVTAIDGKHMNAFMLYDGKPRAESGCRIRRPDGEDLADRLTYC